MFDSFRSKLEKLMRADATQRTFRGTNKLKLMLEKEVKARGHKFQSRFIETLSKLEL